MEGTTQLLQSPSLVGSYLSTWNPVVTLVLIRKDLILEGLPRLPCHRTENKEVSRYIYRVIRKYQTQSNPRDFSQQSHTAKKVDFKGLGWYCNGLSILVHFPRHEIAINHHLSFCGDKILSIYFQVCVEMTHEPHTSWTYWYGYTCVFSEEITLIHALMLQIWRTASPPTHQLHRFPKKNPVVVQSFQINMRGIIR